MARQARRARLGSIAPPRRVNLSRPGRSAPLLAAGTGTGRSGASAAASVATSEEERRQEGRLRGAMPGQLLGCGVVGLWLCRVPKAATACTILSAALSPLLSAAAAAALASPLSLPSSMQRPSEEREAAGRRREGRRRKSSDSRLKGRDHLLWPRFRREE